mmetsp:Transcript_779/g.1645  ORF Transcript_779/g.1645 Transcript_779/m.1645 type:complete len:929 (+) Transcript_779:117-2903(+)
MVVMSLLSNDDRKDHDPMDGNDHHEQQQEQQQQICGIDELPPKMLLRRLLHRMERYEDFSILQQKRSVNERNTTATGAAGSVQGEDEKEAEDENDDDDCDGIDASGKDSSGLPFGSDPRFRSQQSWHSLLVRARLCQDIWHVVAGQNVDEGSDPELRREYLELSQRVDAACKRAHVLADHMREKEERSGREVDLVGKLFFSNGGGGEAKSDGEDDGTTSEPPHEDDGHDEEGNNDHYDEFEEEEEGESSSEADDTGTPETSRRRPTVDASNMRELQKAQREQMEEAIAMMAKQMKESTMGIQNQIRQQTAATLDELEDVAEQNVEDVSNVANGVKKHVSSKRKKTWATWSMMILIGGMFVLTLLTIFAVPKSPDASLGKMLRQGPYARLVRKTVGQIRSAFRSVVYDDDDDDDDSDADADAEDQDHEEVTQHYEEYTPNEATREAERLEKERLERLVQDMRRGGRKAKQQQQQQEEVEIQPDGTVHYNTNTNDEFADEELRIVNGEYLTNDETHFGEENGEHNGSEEKVHEQNGEEEEIRGFPNNEEANKIENDEADNSEHDNPWGIAPEPDQETKAETKEAEDFDNPWGVAPEEDLEAKAETKETEDFDNPWGIAAEEDVPEQPDRLSRKERRRRRREEQTEEEPPKPPEEVNVDDIFASLKKLQKQGPSDVDHFSDEGRADPTGVPSDDNSNSNNVGAGFDPNHAFQREGLAARQISPRDFRVAAASNDLEALERYLEIAPEHINRHDKHGWTALHFAVNAQHERIVRLLLNHWYEEEEQQQDLGIDVKVETNEGATAFGMAWEMFGLDHPLTNVFYESGWYQRSNYEGWDEEDSPEEEDEEQAEEDSPEEEDEELARQRAAEEEAREDRLLDEQNQHLGETVGIVAEKRDRLFAPPDPEDEDDEDDAEAISARRSRLDALLSDEL